MSEHKRLTHNEAARRWESLKLGRADLAEHEDALCADHLQAREDVKRLVEMFRKIQESGGIPGWAAHEVHALLSEVGQ